MLMAAGLGTRLRPFTEITPKPMLPLLGIPMAQFGADSLVEAGVQRIVANIHHLPEQARVGLHALDLGAAELVVSDERNQLLGSSGGLRNARTALGKGPFFLINSDVLCSVDLKSLELRHQELRRMHGVTLTLAIFKRGPDGGAYREIMVDQSSGLISKLGVLEKGRPFFVGVAVIEPEALDGVPDGPAEFVPTVLAPAVAAGKAGAFLTEGEWHDIGSPLLWHAAHLSLMSGLEAGKLPKSWEKKLLLKNERVGPGIWIKKGSPLPSSLKGWRGPSYWAAEPGSMVPGELGPGAVVYGDLSGSLAGGRAQGIGYQGLWSSIN